MAKDLDYLDALRAAIRIEHKCDATHAQTTVVSERISAGQTLWHGHVETFNLVGHHKSAVCYAWHHGNGNEGFKIFAVLANRFIDSPSKAVKAALFIDAQPPTMPMNFEIVKQLLGECRNNLRKIAMTVEGLDAAVETARMTRENVAGNRQASA